MGPIKHARPQSMQNDNDIIDWISELQHYGQLYKSHKIRNICQSDIANQTGRKPDFITGTPNIYRLQNQYFEYSGICALVYY